MIAILVVPRFFMSSKIFSQAMRSVCGVLKFHFFTGETACTAPAKLISGVCASSASGMIAIVLAVVEPAEQRVDLVLLDQPRGEGARLIGVAGVVVDDELDLLAGDAALGVDVGDIHFQRLLLGIAEERGAAGDRQHRADLDLGLRRDRRSAASAAAAVIIFSGSLIAVLPLNIF